MLSIKQLIATLKQFPEEAQCHAYDGEVQGIVVSLDEQAGFVACSKDPDTDNLVELLSE